MENYKELSALMVRVIHKYTQWENKKRTYGTGILLSRSEIHTIEVIGDNPNINVTGVANELGITKGAASQMIYKLVDKGAVLKKTSPNSDVEILLNLTENGIKNYNMHNKLHKSTTDASLEILKNMPESFVKETSEFLTSFEKIMDEKLHTE